MRSKCTICGEPIIAFGFCNKHYTAYKKYGNPLTKLNPRNEPFESRYVVDASTGCWVWPVTNPAQRYGWWKAHGEIKAHRASWVLHNGAIPPGVQVLHKCDNPRCVNPAHLFLGTQQDNMDDMRAKGRARNSAGVSNTRAKLNEIQVRLIRADTRSRKDVAEAYGLHPETIARIQRRELWPLLQ